MLYQRTLQSVVSATGVGLHSGKRVSILLRPAAVNTGIVFRRIDMPDPVEIHVRPDNVSDTLLSTRLSENGCHISTVEHLLAALSGLGIDNLYIDIDSPEVPIMDGSAAPFVYLIQSVGVETQSALKKLIRVKKTIEYRKADKWVRLQPFDGFKLAFSIDFNHPLVNQTRQFYSINLSNDSFTEVISRARTFGFMRDIELLRSRNLGLGGSFDNAIVLDDYRVLNPGGLRCEDEFVKHKILDAVGDLYTLGFGLIASFEGCKSGHSLNNALLRKLLRQEDAWEVVSCGAELDGVVSYPDVANGLAF